MQPNKEKSVYATNFAYSRDSQCVLFSKKAIVLLLSVHMWRSGRITLSETKDYSISYQDQKWR